MIDQPAPANALPLPFTGERFTPECVREIWYEHWHRYAFARALTAGKRVLDAACGEGYGSAFLAGVAAHVTGIDLDPSTIEHARARYADIPNLDFRVGSVTEIDAPDMNFDVLVSFETIEHLTEQEAMLDEFRRVLKPDGLLVISSPDRENYNAESAEPNPFHVRELDRSEFESLLRARFPAIRMYGQKLAFHSLIWRLQGGGGAQPAEHVLLNTQTGDSTSGFDQAPVYHVALAAGSEACLPDLPALSLFSDRQSSVYSHYNTEIARLIRADRRIIELERQLAALTNAQSGSD